MTVKLEVQVGPPVMSASEASAVPGLAKRRAAAAVREGSTIVRDEARRLARPHRRTGSFEAHMSVDTPTVSGDTVIGGITLSDPQAAEIEGGRGPVHVVNARALRLAGIRVPPLAGGRATGFAGSVGPAQGLHVLERAHAATQGRVELSAEKWARAIAEDIRGRIGRG